MVETLQIGVMAVSGALFALGGTGFKWARRFVLPACLWLLGSFFGSWWQGLGYALTLCAFLCLGYGERASWWYRALIFTGYGASALWFGFSWWVVLTPIICLALFWLSNWKPTANMFWWKMVEFIYGLLISITFISCVN